MQLAINFIWLFHDCLEKSEQLKVTVEYSWLWSTNSYSIALWWISSFTVYMQTLGQWGRMFPPQISLFCSWLYFHQSSLHNLLFFSDMLWATSTAWNSFPLPVFPTSLCPPSPTPRAQTKAYRSPHLAAVQGAIMFSFERTTKEYDNTWLLLTRP